MPPEVQRIPRTPGGYPQKCRESKWNTRRAANPGEYPGRTMNTRALGIPAESSESLHASTNPRILLLEQRYRL